MFPCQARLGRFVATPVGQVVCVCLPGPGPARPGCRRKVLSCQLFCSLSAFHLHSENRVFSSGQEAWAGLAALGAHRCGGKAARVLGAILASDCPSAALEVLWG